MQYIHVINLEKYLPGYKDRNLSWFKIYFRTSVDEKTNTKYSNFFDDEIIESLDEITKYRFISLIAKEAEMLRPVPIDEKRIKSMGWDIKKRPIHHTLSLLQGKLITCNSEDENPVSQNRIDKNRIEENREDICAEFLDFYKTFPGRKSKTTDFNEFKKKNPNWKEILLLLLPALNLEIDHKKKLRDSGQFCPEWKNLSSWLNQRCWEQELPKIITKNICSNCKGKGEFVSNQGYNCKCHVCGGNGILREVEQVTA